jgi:hypothetical protein
MTVAEDLVLTTNRVTASGHHYDDRTGVSYEYPLRYRNLIRPGRRFVYYRGRDGAVSPHYFGSGIVGEVRDSQNPGLLVCEILDFRPFTRAAPFVDSNGHHLEPGGDARGFYQPGVRRIPANAFERIILLGGSEVSPPGEHPGQDVRTRRPSTRPRHAQYAPSEVSRAIEVFAIGQAQHWLVDHYPGCAVEEMPRNNPGFDLRVVDSSGEIVRYVEAKGTAAGLPSFFLSDGERRFSQLEASRFTLLVVWAIDLEAGACTISAHDGAIEAPGVELTPRQFQGLLTAP